jgi:hypothetical protein
MRVVHMRVPRAAFADTLGEMREWLDRHNIKTQFDADDLAELFRQDFQGSYDDQA